jgi:internalin A
MNAFIGETVWRSGVALKNDNSSALVRADTEDRRVYIRVGGEEHKRRDFLAKIRGEFDAIHASISKLEVREMVPVPGHPEAEPVDFDLLLQLERNGVEAYPVLSNGKMILANAREMLNGIESEAMRQKRQPGGNVTHIHIGGSVGGNIFVGDENG